MKIGVNSDLNIPVKRSAPKHNFGSGAVKLPHSGVETQNNYQENKAKTKETRVVKSEKSEKSETSEAKTVSNSHENNLHVLIIVAGGLAWFLFR